MAGKGSQDRSQCNRGIDELVAEMEAHRGFLFSSGAINHLLEERNASMFMDLLKDRLFSEFFSHIKVNGRFRQIIDDMMSRKKDPYTAVEEVLTEETGRVKWTGSA